MSAHTGRADDRPKSILEEAPESDFASADCRAVGIRLKGVCATQLYQLPHHPVSFSYGQLVPSGGGRIDAIIVIIMNFRREIAQSVVVGNIDEYESLSHVRSFLSVPLLEQLYDSILFVKLQDLCLGV